MNNQNYTKNLWDMNFFEKFKNFLKEKFGINIPEWHSMIIGFSTGVIGGFPLFGLVMTFALSRDKVKGHIADFRKEIGYGMVCFLIVELFQKFLIPL